MSRGTLLHSSSKNRIRRLPKLPASPRRLVARPENLKLNLSVPLRVSRRSARSLRPASVSARSRPPVGWREAQVGRATGTALARILALLDCLDGPGNPNRCYRRPGEDVQLADEIAVERSARGRR